MMRYGRDPGQHGEHPVALPGEGERDRNSAMPHGESVSTGPGRVRRSQAERTAETRGRLRWSALRRWQIVFADGRRYDRETVDGWLEDYRRLFHDWFQRNIMGRSCRLL